MWIKWMAQSSCQVQVAVHISSISCPKIRSTRQPCTQRELTWRTWRRFYGNGKTWTIAIAIVWFLVDLSESSGWPEPGDNGSPYQINRSQNGNSQHCISNFNLLEIVSHLNYTASLNLASFFGVPILIPMWRRPPIHSARKKKLKEASHDVMLLIWKADSLGMVESPEREHALLRCWNTPNCPGPLSPLESRFASTFTPSIVHLVIQT